MAISSIEANRVRRALDAISDRSGYGFAVFLAVAESQGPLTAVQAAAIAATVPFVAEDVLGNATATGLMVREGEEPDATYRANPAALREVARLFTRLAEANAAREQGDAPDADAAAEGSPESPCGCPVCRARHDIGDATGRLLIAMAERMAETR